VISTHVTLGGSNDITARGRHQCIGSLIVDDTATVR